MSWSVCDAELEDTLQSIDLRNGRTKPRRKKKKKAKPLPKAPYCLYCGNRGCQGHTDLMEIDPNFNA